MKKLEKSICVTCPECKKDICIEDAKDIDIIPVGYKGNYRFYTLCRKCNRMVTIKEEDVPKKIARRLKRKL